MSLRLTSVADGPEISSASMPDPSKKAPSSMQPTPHQAPLFVTVGEIVAAHRKIQKLQELVVERSRTASFWQMECEGKNKCIANLEKDLMLARAETTRWTTFWEDYASTLYRARVLVGNSALLAMRAQHTRASNEWREQEKSLATCLSSTTSALETKLSQNAALTKQVKQLTEELNAKSQEVTRLRAALEKGPETAHLEGEIAARDELIGHLRQANLDLSSALSTGGVPFAQRSITGDAPSSASSILSGVGPSPRIGLGAAAATPQPARDGSISSGALVSKMATNYPSIAARGDDTIEKKRAVAPASPPKPSGGGGLEQQLTKKGAPRGVDSTTSAAQPWRRKPVHLLSEEEMDAFLQHELQAGSLTLSGSKSTRPLR